jgi:hypothetical protein
MDGSRTRLVFIAPLPLGHHRVKIVAGPRRLELRSQPSEDCILSTGRRAGWQAHEELNLNRNVRSVLSFPLDDAPAKKLAAGDRLEPSTSTFREWRPATERPGSGWKRVNRTLEASVKGWRLSTNRPPKKACGSPRTPRLRSMFALSLPRGGQSGVTEENRTLVGRATTFRSTTELRPQLVEGAALESAYTAFQT